MKPQASFFTYILLSSTDERKQQMPTYTFRNKTTNEQWTDMMSIAERDQLLSDTNIEQLVVSINLADPIRIGVARPPVEFKERLQHIKNAHPGSTISV